MPSLFPDSDDSVESEIIALTSGGQVDQGDRRDLYTKIMALRVLKKWNGDYTYDNVLSEVKDRELFAEENLADLSMIIKWNAERKRQTDEDKYVFILPRKILCEQDVHEYVEACHNMLGIPRDFPDHENLEFLSSMLDLSPLERIALNHALSMPGSHVSTASSYTYSRISSLDEYKNPEDAYQLLAHISAEQFKELQRGTLRRTGILVQRPTGGLFALNDDLSTIFRRPGLTAQYLEDTLFPSSVSTSLNVSDYPHVTKETTRVMQIVDRGLASGRAGNNIMLWGGPGTGKTELVLAMAKARGWNLRTIGDISADDDAEKSRGARIASLKLALRILANDKRAVLLFDEMEDLFKSDNNASFSKAFINRLIETAPVPVIWTTNSLRALEHSVLRRMVYNINLETPPAATRIIIWTKYCREIGLRLSKEAIKKLANQYDIAPALIRNAVAVAYAVVGDAKGKRAEAEVHEIVSSLDKLVCLGEERHRPDEDDRNYPYDISCVNSDTNVTRLTSDIVSARPRWSLCLYGAPGTGKSEFGRYLAKQLGKKLVLKRASDLTSMWVGETEKNIAKAFHEAREEEHILLIDEGDSFLRSREKAKNSWEITAVNEMLSQMERHTQPFILTTNLMDDLDAASLRRFTFKLQFNYLSPEQAKKLFKQYFECEAPREIERNHMLAPGDFACVKAQVDIRGITDPSLIYSLLRAETDLKPQSGASIGF